MSDFDQAAIADPRNQALRMKRKGLIVRTLVRDYALKHAANTKKLSGGRPRFTRVDPAWLDRINARVGLLIQAEIERLPSCGRTIV